MSPSGPHVSKRTPCLQPAPMSPTGPRVSNRPPLASGALRMLFSLRFILFLCHVRSLPLISVRMVLPSFSFSSDRQTDTDRQTDRQTDAQTHRHIETHTHSQTVSQTKDPSSFGGLAESISAAERKEGRRGGCWEREERGRGGIGDHRKRRHLGVLRKQG
eukprot:33865-Rhodomonas_salina.1